MQEILRTMNQDQRSQHPLSRLLCIPKTGQRFTVNDEEFVLGKQLGDGAVGVVRKATRVKDDHQLAVKFLAPDPKYIEVSAFDEVASRFKREGIRGSMLEHPCLMGVYAYCDNEHGSAFDGEGPSNPFILMELVEGRNLESHIRKSHVDEGPTFLIGKTNLQFAIQITQALDHLHIQKLVHSKVDPISWTGLGHY